MVSFENSTNMDMVFSIVAAIFIVPWHVVNVHGYSLTNATDSVLGCSHNNTRFANGSFVPTLEPCLNCKCMNANLICALRVCPEQIFPPPRGCVIVQKKNSCCPYITCSKLHTVYKDQEKKVITHDRRWYEQNIRNRLFSQNALQRRIEDSDEEQQLGNEKMCVYNGTVYRSGSAMTTSSLCTYCYCIEGKQKCIQPKCTLPAKIGCEPILIDSSCCPVRYDCTENKMIKASYNTKHNRRRNDNEHYLRMTSRMQRSRGCLVDSTFYPEGHKLPADQSNPCEICFCIGGSKRCAPKKCAPTIRNCKPIIPDGQCCPSSYDCNTISNHKTARGFTSRQYSDIFSLLFGDEEKENSTSSWDYDTETEAINTESNTTNEKGFLDAIKDSLNYVDGNKQTAEQQTFAPNQTIEPVLNLPSYNVSDDDEDDEEEISILDFFLKGESAFTSTTSKPFVFNVTSKPLLNGMTNSPMQIQPVLPENMKNESLTFSMLPMSLYNMVKEDGSVMFDKAEQISQLKSSHPIKSHAHKETETSVKNDTIPHSTASNNITTTAATTTSTTTATTHSPKRTTINSITEISTVISEVKTKSNFDETTKSNKTERINLKNVNKTENSFKKVMETSVNIEPTIAPTAKTKPPKTIVTKRVTKAPSTTTEKIISSSTKISPIKFTSKPKTITPTTKITIKLAPVESSTVSMKPITTRVTTTLPKITAVQINSNPSILESIGYDYSDSTLPPSLPNLKIIPFLPTDAVKNVIHKNDEYKSNFNYYHTNQNSYANQGAHIENTAYSPFNTEPNVDKYPIYNANIADDRVDYDSYKMPAEHMESLDYINVFANSGNMVKPTSFQLNVNSKLDYSSDQKIIPTKISINKNLTVKPPLPPFEPEHEYDSYNLPPKPQPQLHPEDNYQYNINSPISHEPYSPEHNYNVPHFVTMPPLSGQDSKDTVFSYGNKFIPPAKTEGGFIPKSTAAENYIPLRGPSYTKNLTKVPPDAAELQPNDNKIKPESFNQTNFEKHIISITTDDNIRSTEEYNDAFLGVDILGPYKKQSEEYELSNENSNLEFIADSITFNNLYHSTTLKSNDLVSSSTPHSTTVAGTSKIPSKNLTNNTIPLKLITILNNTKKESPTRVEIPQRKNNKIIDPTDEPLIEDKNMPTATTEMTSTDSEKKENSTILRDVFLSTINHPATANVDTPEKPPLFLSRPINKFNFPSLNSLESKHTFQTNPIRSELDFIIPEMANIANTESYVVNPVDVDKLKQHQSNGETEIFTPPHKEPSGLLKLAGCNIYGRMYRVGRIIAELSSSCLECRCTEVGVSCTPLNC